MSQVDDGFSIILGILGNSSRTLDIRKASDISPQITIYSSIFWIDLPDASVCSLCKFAKVQPNCFTILSNIQST